jgi:hypothetical protein
MSTKLAVTSGGGGALAPEDVFAAWTHTGTGATQSIQNGINLSGFGGMVWVKGRSGTLRHSITDTVRGTNSQIATDSGSLFTYTDTNAITAFNTNGFTVGADSTGFVNGSAGTSYASLAFRRASRFFDIVTYTGTGAARTIAHNLGIAPGFIMVKRLDGAGNPFWAFHVSAGAGNYLDINSNTAATADTTFWNNTAPTASVFSLGTSANINASGGSYVAYLFAHDTTSNGIIQCGTYTGNQTSGVNVTLGWEPQFLLTKSNNGAVSWALTDMLREMSITGAAMLQPNNTDAEILQAGQVRVRPDGFRLFGTSNSYNTNSGVHYYVAIRRPTKRPLSATQVFSPHTYTGTAAARTITTPGFAPDLLLGRTPSAVNYQTGWFDRLRGPTVGLSSTQVSQQIASSSTQDLTSLTVPTGYALGSDFNWRLNGSSAAQVAYAFKRAPGFFDVMTYTGTGVAQAISHALGAIPELIIVKGYDNANDWAVYHASLGNTQYALVNSTAAAATASVYWNNTSPTLTQFTVGTDPDVNANTGNYVAYLFATSPGISKVGTYTGNGTSQNIDCGFSTGARFVMVKRTSANGPATSSLSNGWNVADTARGIGASTEPTNSLNTTNTDRTPNWLGSLAAGFTVIQDADNDLNVSGATYIYLAIA